MMLKTSKYTGYWLSILILAVDTVMQSSGEAKIKARMETYPNIRGNMKTQIRGNNLRTS